MIARVTKMGHLLVAVSAFAFLLSSFQMASAQTSLGDEFIVFVQGKNVLVPFYDGQTVTDPSNPDNKVAQFQYGDYAAPGFRWDNKVGVDMTGMVAPTVAEGKVSLNLKILVDPANAGVHACVPLHGDDCLSITFFDGFEGNDAAQNREGRLKWFIPDSLRDGKWHSLSIPLPPNSVAALDAAKAGKNPDGSDLASPLDPMIAQWEYVGGWAGYGWGGTAGSPHGAADANWQEFEWNNVRGIAMHFDWGGGGGGALVDDVYLGAPGLDLSTTTTAPAAMSAVSMVADGAANKISWSPNPDFGAYKVYIDSDPITESRIASGAVKANSEVAFNASAFEVMHNYEIPHGSMLPFPLYYAVTSLNLFGVENTDVSASSGSVTNPDLKTQSYVVEVDNAGANTIFNSLSSNQVSDAGFPSYTIPFDLGPGHWKSADGNVLPDNEDDASAVVKVGFNRTFSEIYIYAEVKDDELALHPGGPNAGAEAWGYDSVEFGWGSYDVRDVTGGSILRGSPHNSFQRGSTPDYQLRIAWTGDETALTPDGGATFVTTGSPDTGQGNVSGGGTRFARLKNAQGANIGYKFLTLFSFSDLVFGQSGDQLFTPPPVNGVKLIPFNISINDGDNPTAVNPRNLQVQWSISPTADGQWWNTPSQWMTVAVVGSGAMSVAAEDEVVPGAFALKQNYPNPFNPSTSISFTLPQTEKVTLSVYNLLGQKVASLLTSEQLNVGTHEVPFDASHLASGMYLYRLDAGTSFSKTLSMTLLK